MTSTGDNVFSVFVCPFWYNSKNNEQPFMNYLEEIIIISEISLLFCRYRRRSHFQNIFNNLGFLVDITPKFYQRNFMIYVSRARPVKEGITFCKTSV